MNTYNVCFRRDLRRHVYLKIVLSRAMDFLIIRMIVVIPNLDVL